MNRTEIAKLNSFVAIGSKITAMLIAVISRKVFLYYFGVEYLGLNSVVMEVISMLNLSELGFATAFLYLLYKPFANKDYVEVASIMYLYKKIYNSIGVCVLVAGIVLSFFLGAVIDLDQYGASLVYTVFYIDLVAAAATYFLAYKRALFMVDQKAYAINIVDTIVNTIFGIGRIISIIIVRNYIVYLILEVGQNFICNAVVFLMYDIKYKFIKEIKPKPYEKKKELMLSVRDLVGGKIANYVYKSTDNLVVSRFLGAGMVGYLVNYTILRNYIKQIVESLAAPIVPMMGNYIHSENDKKRVHEVFYAYTYIRYSIISVFCCGFVVMAHLLITIWLGKEFVLSTSLVGLMAMDLLLSNIMGPSGDYISVLGLFKFDRNISWCGAAINIVTSIILVRFCGMEGVLMGTVVSQLFFTFVRGFGIFKYYFGNGFIKYLITQCGMLVHFSVSSVLSWWLVQRIQISNGVLLFIIGGIVCVCVNILLNCLMYCKTRMFRYTLSMVLQRRGRSQ